MISILVLHLREESLVGFRGPRIAGLHAPPYVFFSNEIDLDDLDVDCAAFRVELLGDLWSGRDIEVEFDGLVDFPARHPLGVEEV